jgi:sterol desaturase/sphingolipid hydroxylase (fatty acid hydroxylase superfamily)
MISAFIIFITQFLFYVQPFVNRSNVLIYLRSFFQSDWAFYVTMVLGINFLTRFLVDLFYVILYYFQFKVLNKYRVNRVWLWDIDKQYYQKVIYSFIHFIWINLVIFIPLTMISFDAERDFVKIDPMIVPEWHQSFIQIMCALIMYDFMFFVIHHVLHTKYFYWIHKMHHEYNNPVIWSDAHTSFIEVVLVAVLPNFIIGMFVNMHIYTLCMFIIVSISLGISQHSGYDLPYSPFYLIPFSDTYRTHNIHHSLLRVNYAPYWSFWDRICGSYKYN